MHELGPRELSGARNSSRTKGHPGAASFVVHDLTAELGQSVPVARRWTGCAVRFAATATKIQQEGQIMIPVMNPQDSGYAATCHLYASAVRSSGRTRAPRWRGPGGPTGPTGRSRPSGQIDSRSRRNRGTSTISGLPTRRDRGRYFLERQGLDVNEFPFII